jgi:1-acylglycerone phosphate reductase
MCESSTAKVVLVTGSSAGGIGASPLSSPTFREHTHPSPLTGYALCEEYASQGCIVYASARRLEALQGLPDNVHKVALDVNSVESAREVVQQIVKEQGRIDILVNNAGAGGSGALMDADVESEEGAKRTVRFRVLRRL